jgi:hypothetical protein
MGTIFWAASNRCVRERLFQPQFVAPATMSARGEAFTLHHSRFARTVCATPVLRSG